MLEFKLYHLLTALHYLKYICLFRDDILQQTEVMNIKTNWLVHKLNCESFVHEPDNEIDGSEIYRRKEIFKILSEIESLLGLPPLSIISSVPNKTLWEQLEPAITASEDFYNRNSDSIRAAIASRISKLGALEVFALVFNSLYF